MELTKDERRRVSDLHKALARVILDSDKVPCIAICATLIHLAGASLNALILSGHKSRRDNLDWAKRSLERSVDMTLQDVSTAAEQLEARDATKN